MLSIETFTALPQQQLVANAPDNVLIRSESGAGATTALLMAACRHLDAAEWTAVVFAAGREGMPTLLANASRILQGTGAKYMPRQCTYIFPSGATLVLDVQTRHTDKYKGSTFSFVGFNQLERFDQKFVQTMATRARERTVYREQPVGVERLLSALGLNVSRKHDIRPRVCGVVGSDAHVEWADTIFQTHVWMLTSENVHLHPEQQRMLRVHVEHYAD